MRCIRELLNLAVLFQHGSAGSWSGDATKSVHDDRFYVKISECEKGKVKNTELLFPSSSAQKKGPYVEIAVRMTNCGKWKHRSEYFPVSTVNVRSLKAGSASIWPTFVHRSWCVLTVWVLKRGKQVGGPVGITAYLQEQLEPALGSPFQEALFGLPATCGSELVVYEKA